MITGKDLVNRDGAEIDGKRRRDPVAEPSAAERLALLEERIKRARALQPSAVDDLRCRQGFMRGRDAVLELLGGSA